MARVALNLGLAYRRLGELALSENHMRQASQAFGELGIVPNQARSLTNLGRLMLDMGKPDQAREIIDSLRQLDPEGAAEQAAIDHLDGELAQYEERFAEAGELMEAARAHHLEDPDSPHVLLIELELAELRLAQGELITAEREARRLADRFADLAYTNERIQALMLYADALLAQQRADEARDWLQQAESLLADAPDAKQRLQLALLTCRLETLPERRRQLEITRQLAADQGFGELWATAQAQLTSLEP